MNGQKSERERAEKRGYGHSTRRTSRIGYSLLSSSRKITSVFPHRRPTSRYPPPLAQWKKIKRKRRVKKKMYIGSQVVWRYTISVVGSERERERGGLDSHIRKDQRREISVFFSLNNDSIIILHEKVLIIGHQKACVMIWTKSRVWL